MFGMVYDKEDELLQTGLFRIRLQAEFVGRTPEARLRKNGLNLNADKNSRRSTVARRATRRVALAA